MSGHNERDGGHGESTVRLDAEALRAAFAVDKAVDVAQHQPPRRRRDSNISRRWLTAEERTALISTVGAAMHEGYQLDALRSLMQRALTMDPTRPAYPAMRAVLADAAPQVGFICPQCQQTTPSGVQAKFGWCTYCLKETGGEWYPRPTYLRPRNSAPVAGREWPPSPLSERRLG